MSAPFLGPLPIQPIVERLIRQLGRDWKEIAGAADLAAAQEAKSPAAPAAYVLLGTDQPSDPQGSSQRLVQTVTGRWGVIIAIRDYRASQRGAGESAELIDRITQVRQALLGWPHPNSNGTTTRLGGPGRVLQYAQGIVWWQDIYAGQYHIRTSGAPDE